MIEYESDPVLSANEHFPSFEERVRASHRGGRPGSPCHSAHGNLYRATLLQQQLKRAKKVSFHSSIHSSIHPSIHLSIHPFIYSSIYPFIHSFTHSLIHSFICFRIVVLKVYPIDLLENAVNLFKDYLLIYQIK